MYTASQYQGHCNYSPYSWQTQPLSNQIANESFAMQLCDRPTSTYSDSSLSSSSTPPTFSRPLSRSSAPKKTKSRVSRPPNAFLLFRSDLWAQEKQKVNPVERDHRDISRIAAHCWKNLDPITKQAYHDRAVRLREIHQLQHPEYKYSPARKTRTMKKVKETTEDDERCARLASLIMPEVVESTRQVFAVESSSCPPLVHPAPLRPQHSVPSQLDDELSRQSQVTIDPWNTLCLYYQQEPIECLPDTYISDVEAMIYQIYGCNTDDLQEWYALFRTNETITSSCSW